MRISDWSSDVCSSDLLEIELQAEAKATIAETGRSTVPARKLYDLVRNLPEGAEVRLDFEETKALLRCGRSRITLPVKPANDFPQLDDRGLETAVTFAPHEGELQRPMQRLSFALATNDLRPHFNCMSLSLDGKGDG